MDGPKDIWHIARPLLAKQYLGEFDLGHISPHALTHDFLGQLSFACGIPARR